MNTRRDFLRLLALTTSACAFDITPAFAATRRRSVPPPKLQFIDPVVKATGRLKIAGNRWKMIVAHHSAIAQGNAAIYDKAHRRRGMENGLAYHFVIGNGLDSGDGQIEVGSRWLRQIKGGHVRRDAVNEIAIGICLVGNFEVSKPTKNQLAAFQQLMTFLRTEVTGSSARFLVHREVDPGRTACPGKNFPTKSMHRLYG